MKNVLYAKTLALAIAVSFLIMAGNGLGNDESETVTLEMAAIPTVLQDRSLDSARLSQMIDDRISSMPPIDENSVIFTEDFEDDVLGDTPDDPPWAATEQPSSTYGSWGPDEFEDDIVGNNPDAPWQTVDGSTIPSFWSQNFESYTTGQPMPIDAIMGDDGYFYNMEGTVTIETPPAGSPAGSVQAGLSTGGSCAYFVDGGAGSYWGPAGIGDTTSAYGGGWFYLTADQRLDVILYDTVVNTVVVEVAFYAAGSGLAHWPGGGGVLIAGTTYALNTWHELFIQYNEGTQTYSVWLNGVQYAAGSAFTGGANVDGLLVFGNAANTAYVDNFMHFNPTALGTHDVSVSNAYSSSIYGGTQSVRFDQNNYAGGLASATMEFPSPYAWGDIAGVSWAVMTSTTVANTNGARFQMLDYNDRALMEIRFSGGNIQYNTGGTWTTLQAFAANTEYHFDLYMDCFLKEYAGLYVDESVFYDLAGVPLANLGAGIASFRATGTLSTQSEYYFDHVAMWGELQEGTVRISDESAHSGAQSVRMWEGNGDDYCDMGAYLGGDYATYGEFSFWFYGDGTLGGGQIYLLDTTQTYLVTIISLGADLTAANIPNPGQVVWIDGDGAGGGYIVEGPTIVPNTWNEIMIRYDTVAGTIEPFWNSVSQGVFGMLEAAPDAGIVFFFGEGPVAPVDWFFDDIELWVDDIPGTPQNLRTYFPDPMPGTSNNYFMNQDNAVQGTVTGTYTNTLAIDATTQNIQEAIVTGTGGTVQYTYTGVTQATNDHYAYACDVNLIAAGTGPEYNTQVEALNAEYTAITTSENTRWITVDPGAGDEMFIRSEFQVAETPAYITQIFMSCEIQGAAATDFQIWAVDGAGSWAQIGTAVTATANTDVVIGRAITTNCANYIVGGYLTWGVYQTDASDLVRVDRMNATIVWSTPSYYSLEHRWRTENVPAGADVMKMYVTGWTSGGDDTFNVGYSSVLAGPYAPLVTINSATMTTYSVSMPIVSGQFYINVVDSNSADAAADTVFIDAIRIFWQDIVGATTSNQIATADNPVEGTVVGTYALTNPPANTVAQQITEVDPSSFLSDDELCSPIPDPIPMADIMPVEGFETAVPPTGWTLIPSGADRTWQQSTNGNPYTSEFGTAYAYVNYDSAYAQDEWLVTPSLDCSAYQNLQLTYCIEQGTGWDDYIYIRVSTNGGSTWSGNLVTHFQSGLTMTTADMQTLDLSAYDMSADLQVAFILWTAAADAGDSVALDQVTLTGDAAGTTLEHIWTMNNLPDNAMARNVYATARYNTGSDDNFQFGWSQNVNGPFTPIAGLLVTSDTYQTYAGTLPVDFGAGPLFINVVDTTGGDATYSSLYVDSLYVESIIAPVNTSVNVVWDLSADDGAGQNDVVQYNLYFSDAETAGTEMGPYNYLDSVPAGTGMYKHYGESDDIVYNIWYIVCAQDIHSEGMTTMRATKFNVAPTIPYIAVDGMPFVDVMAGTPVALSANVYDSSSTWEDILKIDGAEWYADADPGVGMANAMTGDGVTDSTTEPFTDTIDTTGWTVGTHLIYVRGHEGAPGNTGTGWGAISVAVMINITGAPAPYAINLAGHLAGEWVFVSFPVEVSGNVETVLNDATNGDGLTTWDIAKWYNPQDAADPWKTYRVSGTSNDLTTITNMMGVWLHLTANGGDGVLTLAVAGGYPAAPVAINLYTGWNLVGYPSATALLGSATLPAQADIVSIWQAAAPYIADSTPAAVTMSHGNAYWVHVTADCIWTVNP